MSGDKLKNLIPLVLLVVVIGIASVAYPALKGNYNPAGGGLQEAVTPASGAEDEVAEPLPAPDFTVFDEDENPVKLSDFLGKAVVINFWASWCPYCLDEMADFQELYNTYGQDIEFLMINSTDGKRETKELAQEYIDSSQLDLPFYFDTNFEASTGYGINSLPMTFIVDKEGNLSSYQRGIISKEPMEKALKDLLGE